MAISAPEVTSLVGDESGRQFVAEVTPPAGSLPEQYTWEWGYPGVGVPNVVQTEEPRLAIDSLTPGGCYSVRVSFSQGNETSPLSNAETVCMDTPAPIPSIFWNGSTEPQPSVEYGFFGPGGGNANYPSYAIAQQGVVGWKAPADVIPDEDGEAVMMQTIDRLTAPDVSAPGDEAALYIVTTADTEQGWHFGTDGTTAGGDVTPERSYVGSMFVRPTQERSLAVQIEWYDSSDDLISRSGVGEIEPFSANEIRRLHVLAVAPADAAYAGVVVTDPPGSDPFEAGHSVTLDGAMLSEGALYPYFSASTPDTDEWDYQTVSDSRGDFAVRVRKAPSLVDPLADPDCPPIPGPPRAPSVDDSCVSEDVTEWRRYWVAVDSSYVSSWADSVPTITISTKDQAERQLRIRYYPNPDDLRPDEFWSDEYAAEQIISYIPANTELTLDGVARRAWASVDGGERLAADSLVHGSVGTPATWPALECDTAWLIAVDVPATSANGNIDIEIELTRRS